MPFVPSITGISSSTAYASHAPRSPTWSANGVTNTLAGIFVLFSM